MRVLITGAAGFAGSHFLDGVLRETDWYAVLLASFRHRGKSDRITEIQRGYLETQRQLMRAGKPFDPCFRNAGRVQTITHDLTTPVSTQTIDQMGDIDWMVCYASE